MENNKKLKYYNTKYVKKKIIFCRGYSKKNIIIYI